MVVVDTLVNNRSNSNMVSNMASNRVNRMILRRLLKRFYPECCASLVIVVLLCKFTTVIPYCVSFWLFSVYVRLDNCEIY